jgi:hypothetical protein
MEDNCEYNEYTKADERQLFVHLFELFETVDRTSQYE